MNSAHRTYICIDLKSFYASVECVARGLDPLTADLVVADPDRGSGTLCLAVSPSLKAKGVRNRCRVWEIPENISYIKAPPRMRRYLEVSADIYRIYLNFVAMEDIHVYSIDECFIDATPYLTLYKVTAWEFAEMLRSAVLEQTGVTATVGIGTNLFLAKVALDITAKKSPQGIGVLDERSFQRTIWTHRPISDIWNIGPGTARRLARYGIFDLKGVALGDPDLLRREFGINSELLIDHAWGREPCTIRQIKDYRPQSASLSNGQVLMRDYSHEEAGVVLKEMVAESVLDLASKHLVCRRVSLMVGYSWKGAERFAANGQLHPDYLSRSGASRVIGEYTDSLSTLQKEMEKLFEESTYKDLPIRRLGIGFSDLLPQEMETITLFTDLDARKRERKIAQTMLSVRHRFGKNALIRGSNLYDCSTGMERNRQIGGHRA